MKHNPSDRDMGFFVVGVGDTVFYLCVLLCFSFLECHKFGELLFQTHYQ